MYYIEVNYYSCIDNIAGRVMNYSMRSKGYLKKGR